MKRSQLIVFLTLIITLLVSVLMFRRMESSRNIPVERNTSGELSPEQQQSEEIVKSLFENTQRVGQKEWQQRTEKAGKDAGQSAE